MRRCETYGQAGGQCESVADWAVATPGGGGYELLACADHLDEAVHLVRQRQKVHVVQVISAHR